MKFVKEEMTSKERPRYLFALGKEEATIMLSLLDKAYRYMPKTFRTMPDNARVRSMVKTMKHALPEMIETETGFKKNTDRNILRGGS